jgi:bifunctional non-homologous end joining protein LigD
VSVPIAWEELTPELRSDQWTIRTLPARLAGLKADPWEDFEAARTTLSARVLRQLGG